MYEAADGTSLASWVSKTVDNDSIKPRTLIHRSTSNASRSLSRDGDGATSLEANATINFYCARRDGACVSNDDSQGSPTYLRRLGRSARRVGGDSQAVYPRKRLPCGIRPRSVYSLE